MKSIGNAGAERLLFSSFQLSPLLSSLFFSLLFDLELEYGRSSSGPISLNSRGVHEVCEMAERNPEVRRRGGRARRVRARTEGEKRISEKGTSQIRQRSIVYLLFSFIPEHSFLNMISLLILPFRKTRDSAREQNYIVRVLSHGKLLSREMSEKLDPDTRRRGCFEREGDL